MGKVTVNPALSSAERTAEHAPTNATYLEVYVAKLDGTSGTYRYYLGNLITDINASEYNFYNILRGYDYYVTINLNDIDGEDPRFAWD
jgi:formiminotetrahydrofolate cyclodeaminase